MKSTEKELEFENQTKGTIFTLLKILTWVPSLLFLIGLFLPVCKIEILDISYTAIDCSIGTLGVLFIGPLSISIVEFFGNYYIKPKLINETINIKKAAILISVGVAVSWVTIMLSVFQLHLDIFASDMDLNREVVANGAGSVLINIASFCHWLLFSIEYTVLLSIYSGKIKISELTKFLKNQRPMNTEITNAEELRKLKNLLDEGVISQEEFDTKKKELLHL